MAETIDIFSPTFRRLTDKARIIVQAAHMRLNTKPGTYFEDPEYGIDTDDLLLDGVDASRLPRLAARFAQEIEKDERVESASVQLVTVSSGSTTSASVVIDVTPLEGDSFSLTIGVPDLTVEMLLRGT